MKKRNILILSVTLGFVISILLSYADFSSECRRVRDEVLRLHVLADSDSAEDQAVKLLVRDAILACGAELFSGETNKENVNDILCENNDIIKETANEVLKENGFDYTAEISLTEEYFTTRTYDGYTLPAGEYLALKVVLGEGKGRNWWCVMFPPLCLPAATADEQTDVVLGKDGAELICKNPEYEIRFKIVEIFEEIKNYIKQ